MIYTIGYQGRRPAELLVLAELHDAIVTDIRYRARSSNPEWGKAPLQRLLGARYAHSPEFGNTNYRGGPIELLDPVRGVRQVAPLLEPESMFKSVMLMCACRRLKGCHREQVAELVATATGHEVVHL